MKDIIFFIQPAREEDLPQVNQLLISTGLPTAGVEANIENFLVARGKNGEILAVIGMEINSTNALLRSLASFAEFRKQGIASELVLAALHKASLQGIKKLYLMTCTAERYLQKFGFKIIGREEIPESLLAVSKLNSECPDNSKCMELLI